MTSALVCAPWDVVKLDATDFTTAACGNTQLCAGLRSGIKGNLHAVRAIWPQSAGWTEDAGDEDAVDGPATVDSIA